MEVFTQISKARQCIKGSESLQAVPERVIQEAVRIKPKLHWRPGCWRSQEHETSTKVLSRLSPRERARGPQMAR
jgi:hypothetical protein